MSVLLALAFGVATQPDKVGLSVRPAHLDAIAKTCRVPRAWFALRGQEVVFRGSPDADPAKLECALEKMSALIAAANGERDGNAKGRKEKK